VQSKDKIKIITVRTTGFDAVSVNGGSAAVETLRAGADAGLSRSSAARYKSERPRADSARVVVSGGRGMGSGDNFKVLEPLADKLGARWGLRVRRWMRDRAERLAGRGRPADRRAGPLHRRGISGASSTSRA